MKGELYHRMLKGILSRCVGHEETQRKLEKVHSKTCGICKKVSLYHRLQRVSFYWPDINKEADQVQGQCEAYQLAMVYEKRYALFIVED